MTIVVAWVVMGNQHYAVPNATVQLSCASRPAVILWAASGQPGGTQSAVGLLLAKVGAPYKLIGMWPLTSEEGNIISKTLDNRNTWIEPHNVCRV